MKSRKKSRKLMIQVALVTVPLFLLMIAAVVFVMYKNTVDSFLETQNDNISTTLEKLYGTENEYEEYLLDFWEQNPESSRKPFEDISEEDKKAVMDIVLSDVGVTKEIFETLNENQKKYCASMLYSLNMINIGFVDSEKEKYDFAFIMDITEPNEGLIIYMSAKDDNSQKMLGDRIDLDMSDHKILEDMIKSGSDRIAFEKTENFMGEESRYIGYKPIIINGKVRAVVGVAYNWNEFSKSMTSGVFKAILIGIGYMILIITVVFVLLYRIAIKPVGRIQKSVCEYIDSKDSEKVTKEMAKVKTGNEIGLLSDNISELAKEIDNYTAENIRLAGDKERVAAELDMAKNIQVSQLPSVSPTFPSRKEFDIYASMTPAKQVGGDFYDFFFTDDDHLALVIADVSDKGVPAALFMMMSKILINTFASMGLEPHEVIERTNDKLCENNSQRMFVTVWYGVLELSTGKVTAVNAGHEYPVVKHADGFEAFKEKHCLVVGAMKGVPYTQYEFALQKGDSLFVYTDGVPEATNSDMQMFGMDRLVDALNENPDAAPKELLENVRRAVDDFVGDAQQFDDLTMLGIKLM